MISGNSRAWAVGALTLVCALAGCRSVDCDAKAARDAIRAGNLEPAIVWSEELATDSSYSTNEGLVEAGRVQMLAGNMAKAEQWFQQAVDAAIDRKEAQPKIKLGDVGNEVLSGTVTDDRTREYYLVPYELNLALEYGIIAKLCNGRRDDALVDSRLAVFVQDNLASTYGADIRKSSQSKDAKTNQATGKVYSQQTADLQAMMAATRNSWENPALWYLTGVLFEADNDLEMAWQSYRKAAAVQENNAVFTAAVVRAEGNVRTPAANQAKLVVLYEDGLVPQRESLKIPVPVYTGMSIDLPVYPEKQAYFPPSVSISGAKGLAPAAPSLNVRSLAARDLNERLPGVIVRNITRAAVQAGAQAAANAVGNNYAKVAVFVGNVVISALRRADTRSWVTLPDGQQLWTDGAMMPGEYQIGVTVNGRTVAVPMSLKPGETHLLWIADDGVNFRTASAKL